MIVGIKKNFYQFSDLSFLSFASSLVLLPSLCRLALLFHVQLSTRWLAHLHNGCLENLQLTHDQMEHHSISCVKGMHH